MVGFRSTALLGAKFTSPPLDQSVHWSRKVVQSCFLQTSNHVKGHMGREEKLVAQPEKIIPGKISHSESGRMQYFWSVLGPGLGDRQFTRLPAPMSITFQRRVWKWRERSAINLITSSMSLTLHENVVRASICCHLAANGSDDMYTYRTKHRAKSGRFVTVGLIMWPTITASRSWRVSK
jgi:hypothetical protein